MSHSRHRIVFLLFFTVAVWTATACTKDKAQTAQAVRSVMEAQQASWNRGDIEAFMDGYERADSTTFVSGEELARGWQTVLARYKRRYASREQMGTLAFSDLEVQPIGADYAIADGRWRLTTGNGMPHGRFTLLFKQTGAGWRIVHDTTTSSQ